MSDGTGDEEAAVAAADTTTAATTTLTDLLRSVELGRTDRIDWKAVAARISSHPLEAAAMGEDNEDGDSNYLYDPGSAFSMYHPLVLALKPYYYGDNGEPPPNDVIESVIGACAPPDAETIDESDDDRFEYDDNVLYLASKNPHICPTAVRALVAIYPSWARLISGRYEADNSELPYEYRQIPLHQASNAAKARILLQAYPAGIDKADYQGQLPLHTAVYDYRVDVVKTLLDADPSRATRALTLLEDVTGRTRFVSTQEDASNVTGRTAFLDTRDEIHGEAAVEIIKMLWDVCPPGFEWPYGFSPARTQSLDRLLQAPYGRIDYTNIDWRDVIWRLLSHPEEARIGSTSPRWEERGWASYPLQEAISSRHDGAIHFPVAAARAFVDAFPFAATAEARDHQGRTALHLACDYIRVPSKSLKVIFDTDPTSATVSDSRGDLPLHLALRSGRSYNRDDDGILASIVAAAPSALETRDSIMHLYPYQIAASSAGDDTSLDTIYNLLRLAPQVMSRGSAP